MTQQEVSEYEAASLWFTGILPTRWMAQYLVWKVRRKWRNYYRRIEVGKILNSDMTAVEKFTAFRELDSKISNT